MIKFVQHLQLRRQLGIPRPLRRIARQQRADIVVTKRALERITALINRERLNSPLRENVIL